MHTATPNVGCQIRTTKLPQGKGRPRPSTDTPQLGTGIQAVPATNRRLELSTNIGRPQPGTCITTFNQGQQREENNNNTTQRYTSRPHTCWRTTCRLKVCPPIPTKTKGHPTAPDLKPPPPPGPGEKQPKQRQDAGGRKPTVTAQVKRNPINTTTTRVRQQLRKKSSRAKASQNTSRGTQKPGTPTTLPCPSKASGDRKTTRKKNDASQVDAPRGGALHAPESLASPVPSKIEQWHNTRAREAGRPVLAKREQQNHNRYLIQIASRGWTHVNHKKADHKAAKTTTT